MPTCTSVGSRDAAAADATKIEELAVNAKTRTEAFTLNLPLEWTASGYDPKDDDVRA
jgi:hypothetical protein